MVTLSVVIPAYEEARSIPELVKRLTTTLHNLKLSYEIIIVDDGSKDDTWQAITKTKAKGIRLQRNYGKSHALRLGFTEAKGSYVATLDADLQDQPEELVKFWGLRSKYDLIMGWKYRRKDPLHKTIPSRFFNLITRIITGVRVHDANCGMKLMRREVAKSLWLYGELHRYIPAIANWEGFRVGEVRIHHARRKYGRSKYGLSRLVWGILDLVTVKFLMVFGKRPLHFFGLLGLLFSFAGFLIGAHLSWIWLKGQNIGGRPLLLLAILLVLVGIQFFSMGLLGELINRQHQETGVIRETY